MGMVAGMRRGVEQGDVRVAKESSFYRLGTG